VLGDSAAESGVAFEAEMLPDVGDLLLAIVDDFWRVRHGPHGCGWNSRSTKVGPEFLLDNVQPYLGKPYLEIRAPADVAPIWRNVNWLSPVRTRKCVWSSARSVWSANGWTVGSEP
jgi:hypothetical protein